MRLTSIDDYISGKKFSNSLKVKISQPESNILYRMEFIEDLVKSSKIIHLGFADHIEVIEKKIEKNIWFHRRLLQCTSRCVGIDINKAATDFVRSKLNISDVFDIDISKEELPAAITDDHYHFLILGELIEHIDNPVLFLEMIRTRFKSLVDEIVITAPNALRWNNLKYVFKQTELINSDHRYWFTPYTLSKILFQAGYQDMEFYLVESFKPEKHSIFKSYLYKKFPALRNTIIIKARF
jgi:hypothetical protein